MVAVLLIAGDQEPLKPLLEVVGNAANGAPLQIGATALKVGGVPGFTVTFTVCGGPAQPLALGVTV